MAQKYARGARAWGICGRSGKKMLLRYMVFDGRFPNMRVDPEWYESKHPQEYLPKVEDPVALYRPSPEVIAPPTAPVLTTSLQDSTTAKLTWTPAETGITEIESYTIFRGLDGALPFALVTCAVLRDFLGGIIGVERCTTTPSIPADDTSDQPQPSDASGSVFDKPTNHDAPITYLDVGLTSGHTYCYYVVANPMGNNQSVAQGPPSAPSNVSCVTISSGGTITWTSRGNVLGDIPAYAIGSDTAGTTLLVDTNGRVMRSTDGGVTWSLRSSITGFAAGQGIGTLMTANGTWILEAPQIGSLSPAQLFRSTDSGLTWAALSPGFNNAGGITIGTDGAGNWFGIGNLTSADLTTYANSSDDGLTWQFNGITNPIGGTSPPFFVHWNATDKWVLLSSDPVTTLGQIWQSNDGRTWTEITTSGANAPQQLLVLGGVYNATSAENSLIAASLVGLATATPHAIPLTLDDTVGWLVKTSTYWFALDFSGAVAASLDFVTWQAAVLNLPLADFPNSACYDSFHDTAIAAGNSGFVVTYP
jgi:hypothetical protein